MKGISHFVSGVAAASFFPPAVDAAASGNPLYMLLGGFFGLLPDTLDFKFIRYFCKYDIEVALDPLDPDPSLIADALVRGLLDAAGYGRKVCIKLHSIRLAADRWLAYRVEIDRAGRRIIVELGDVLDTGGNIVCRWDKPRKSTNALPCDLVMDYGFRVDVTYLEGPTLLLCPEKGYVRSVFIHWHREWSHSLAMAGVCGLVMFMFAGLTAGAIAGMALLLHIGMDQAGYMGNNLLFPWSRIRMRGQRLLRSGTGIWNLVVVWIAVMLTGWNAGMQYTLDMTLMTYLLRVGLFPLLVLRMLLR